MARSDADLIAAEQYHRVGVGRLGESFRCVIKNAFRDIVQGETAGIDGGAVCGFGIEIDEG